MHSCWPRSPPWRWVGTWFRPDRALFDRAVDEPEPADVARVVAEGAFEPRAHDGRGQARILELTNGDRVLHLADFETLDGPDLFVYLVGAPDAAGQAALEAGGYLDLGALKGNVGPQNYIIPASADLSRYAGVSIWCRRFRVNFTTARLSPPAVRD